MTSSDEESPPLLNPQPSGEWHRGNAQKLAEERQAALDRDHREMLDRIQEIAERERVKWAATACGGEDDRASACSDANALVCAERDSDLCPRVKAIQAERERVSMHRKQRKYLESVNVSPRTLRAVYDAPPIETDAVKAVRAALASTPKPTILVLQGGVGCGKSCAAAVWAAETSAKWVTAKALARMGYEDELAQLGKCSALVLDDLGTEYADAKGFFVSNLDGLIDDRYARELQTIITTNVEPEEFKARYGERIADRIREAGKFIQVKGASLRRRA